MRITIARTTQEVERLGPAWEALEDRRDTLFQSFRWNRLAARAFAGRQRPLVVHVESGRGAALIPACQSREGLEFLGEKLFDYRDVLSAGSAGALRRGWQVLAQEGESLPFHLIALAGERVQGQWSRMGFAAEKYVDAPQVRCAEVSAEAFAQQHRRLSRQVRRLAQAGALLREHPGRETRLLRHIFECKAAQRTPEENLFGDPLRREFLVAAAAENGCEIFTLETPGTLVAALVTFRDRGVRRFYTTYYDHHWAHYSPGTALLFEVTRRSLEQGMDSDFMTGAQSHKTRLATSSMPLFRVEASAREMRSIGGEVRLLAA